MRYTNTKYKYRINKISSSGVISSVLKNESSIDIDRVFLPDTVTMVRDEDILPYTLIIRKGTLLPTTISFYETTPNSLLQEYLSTKTDSDKITRIPITGIKATLALEFKAPYQDFINKLQMQNLLNLPLIDIMEQI
jgi:hypothetical protein